MSIYNVGNLRKVTTPTSNTIANAKLKFGGNQTNDDANSANKPVKVSSSISEKIKKLSSSTSSGEISDTVTNNTTSTPNTQAPKNGLNTNGKDKKPASTTPTTPVENGNNAKTNGTKPSNGKPTLNVLSGNISTYITSEVTTTATIKTVNASEKTNEPEKKIVINETNPNESSSVVLKKEEPIVITQVDIKTKTPANAHAEVKNVKLPKVKIANDVPLVVTRANKEYIDLEETQPIIAKEFDGMRFNFSKFLRHYEFFSKIYPQITYVLY